MTSLFDPIPSELRLPPAMVAELVAHGGHHVSLLEFLPVDLVEPEPSEQPVTSPAVDERARAVAIMVDAAREETAADVTRTLTAVWEHRLHEERTRVERLSVEFARDRQRYFAAAEVQVVRLALAVARKVLSREVDSAGLALGQTVKMAIAKVQDGSATVLRVPPPVTDVWRELLAMEARVRVEPDASLAPGECRLDTAVGTVDLGLEVQLAEIGRGFEDLLGREENSARQTPWDR